MDLHELKGALNIPGIDKVKDADLDFIYIHILVYVHTYIHTYEYICVYLCI